MLFLSWLDRRIDQRIAIHEPSEPVPPAVPDATDAQRLPAGPLEVQVVEPGAPDLVVHRRSGLPAVSSEDPELAALLNEQLVLQQRDNILIGATITLASVGAILLSFYLSQFPELCATKNEAGCIANDETYLLAPLPVLAVAGILVFLTINSHITASLLHKVEVALQEKVDFDLPLEPHRGEKHTVRLPSSSMLWGLVFSSKKARSLRIYQLSNLVTLIAIIGMVAGLLIPVMSRVSSNLQLISVAIYGPAFLALYVPFHRSAGTSRRVLNDALEAKHEIESQQPGIDWLKPDPVTNRTPVGYLLLPRPTELLFKSAAMIGAIVLVRLSISTPWVGWGSAAVAFLLFEVVLYQSRYMFNDAIDFAVDRSHARPAGKGRAPDMGTNTRRIIRLAATGRILGCLTGALILLPRPVDIYLLYAGAAVLFFMGPYDRFAELSRERWGGVDSPDKATQAWIGTVPHWPATIRVALVAPGYAIRGMIGAAIALNDWPSLQLVVALALMLGALEASNVALAWVSEGAASVAKGRTVYRATLKKRPHMAWLLLHAGVVSRSYAAVDGSEIDSNNDRSNDDVLLTTPGVNGPRVWNAWMALSIAGAALTGAILNRRMEDLAWSQFLAVGSSSLAIGMLLLVRVRKTGSVKPFSAVNWMILPVSALSAAAATYFTLDDELIWPASATSLLAAVVYQGTRLSTFEKYISTAQTLVGFLIAGVELLMRLRHLPRLVVGFFVGRDLWH